jgi:hypothetical protein
LPIVNVVEPWWSNGPFVNNNDDGDWTNAVNGHIDAENNNNNKKRGSIIILHSDVNLMKNNTKTGIFSVLVSNDKLGRVCLVLLLVVAFVLGTRMDRYYVLHASAGWPSY